MNRSSRILVPVALMAGCLAASVHAQQPAPSADIPPMKCEKPTRMLTESPSGVEISKMQKEVDAYKKCVNDYTKQSSEKAQALIVEANAYRDAANAAIGEYNDYVNALNAKSK